MNELFNEFHSQLNEFTIELAHYSLTGVEIRGGPNSGPVKYVKEVSHVKHLHADSLLVQLNFSSKLMIT